MKQELRLDEIIRQYESTGKDVPIAFIGDDAMSKYLNIHRRLPQDYVVTIADSHSVFTEGSYAIDTNKYEVL